MAKKKTTNPTKCNKVGQVVRCEACKADRVIEKKGWTPWLTHGEFGLVYTLAVCGHMHEDGKPR